MRKNNRLQKEKGDLNHNSGIYLPINHESCINVLSLRIFAVAMSPALNIRHCSIDELTDHFTSIGEKSFRAKQVYEWLWVKSARSFDEMTNLSVDLRNKLSERFVINPVE